MNKHLEKEKKKKNSILKSTLIPCIYLAWHAVYMFNYKIKTQDAVLQAG